MTSTRVFTRRLTLLELMVVMVLLTITLGFLGVKGAKAMRGDRIDSRTRDVALKIELASRAMVALDKNLELHLSVENEAIHYALTTGGEPFSKGRALLRGAKPTPDVTELEWRGEKDDEVVIHFSALSHGRCDSGELVLHFKGGEKRTLRLRGAPGPVDAT